MKFFVTFGQTHLHPKTGDPLKNYWVEVHADTIKEACKLTSDYFKQKWSLIYTEDEFDKSFFPFGCYCSIESNSLRLKI